MREDATIPANGAHELIVECDTGDVATGGGYFYPGDAEVTRTEPYPHSSPGTKPAPTGWRVMLWNNLTNAGIGTQAYVVCLDTTP